MTKLTLAVSMWSPPWIDADTNAMLVFSKMFGLDVSAKTFTDCIYFIFPKISLNGNESMIDVL